MLSVPQAPLDRGEFDIRQTACRHSARFFGHAGRFEFYNQP